MMEFLEVAKSVIPFEKLYEAVLDYVIIDVPPPGVIDEMIGSGMYPEEAYRDYLNTLVTNLEKTEKNIDAVLTSIRAKIASGELKDTPELQELLHKLSHERIEPIERVKIDGGTNPDQWIDYKKGMAIRKDDDGISYLYSENGERIGKAIATKSEVIDPGGVREQVIALKKQIRDLPLSKLFDEKDFEPYGLTAESFAELTKENRDQEVIEKIRKMMSYGVEITDVPQRYHDRIEALLQSLEKVGRVPTV